MDKVEKVARAIPDEAVEAAVASLYGRLIAEHHEAACFRMRKAIDAALAVMEREGEALSGYGDYTPVTIRSGTVASPRPEAVGEAFPTEPYWEGTRVDDMTREQLLTAFKRLGAMYERNVIGHVQSMAAAIRSGEKT